MNEIETAIILGVIGGAIFIGVFGSNVLSKIMDKITGPEKERGAL